MSSLVCRQCRKEDTAENLVSPCLCGGNNRYVHCHCLAQVARHFGTERCPACRELYHGVKIQQTLQGFMDYLKENERTRLRLYSSVLVAITLGFYTILLGYVQYLHSRGIIYLRWKILLLLLATIYFIAFTIISFYLARLGKQHFKSWQQSNPKMIVYKT